METRAFCREVQEENRALKRLLQLCKEHFIRMQKDCTKYLEPDNDCDREWLISRILYCLNGPEQRAIQETIRMLLNKQVKDERGV